ncbi:hypothetical protein VE01_01776 [Pseudogymnoascus verrucosus]|uniref:Superoxide dismutase [Mn], mitochondrial n=1 Tax=Pseudogymnoascus verrucosus TaxID=342668 RepID=A0A1B8GW91_9PEZI|nr:uncharacterized protein VE01_01776 [Pseudogymnoascus verrucosus]OBU00061.1 hypothetical protein VE01_01776 [Pseudogymnoascus verrucosus]
MAWEHLSINKPHLVYLILGGFTSLFMLCSSFIKERLYIGEATVATICGIIFGPHAANLIDPSTWGNVDQITLEFSRIVLVVQCFAVGVELPKYYMEKHWRSVTFLLIPVMTFGWLVTSLFIWWMVPTLNWLESLVVASCVTATDPVLASSVVGKGKFAKRVPKHLRDLLSAESGCNDGMAFPFVYLGLYIIHYKSQPSQVAFHWIVVSILYECVFGAIYGFVIGYIGRRGIRWAEKNDLVDRESFLVFYFVLALFCAGSGSLLGVDDLLVGFAAGVGFSNDGWFTQKTEESHVSNVIDLLINLAYFVYFGTIIPWDQFNSPELGTSAWKLVIIALFVVFFRRIPIMLALKPFIPDIKSWREALFAGHFGPIGVGAIFIAILARADLETGSTTPLAVLPAEGTPHYHLIALIWPIVTFLVITSIIIHGSSIAVFTLGKHINTLTLTMSYTTANEEGPSWMNRLPRISSQSKSMSKMSDTDADDIKMEDLPPGALPPVGVPGAFLRRQKEEDTGKPNARSSSIIPRRRKKSKWDGYGPGGPVSQSAIAPQPRNQSQNTSATLTPESTSHEGEGEGEEERGERVIGKVQHDEEMEEIMHHGEEEERPEHHKSNAERHPHTYEAYQEGDHVIIENEDGDVLSVEQSPPEEGKEEKLGEVGAKAKEAMEHPETGYKQFRKKIGEWRHRDEGEEQKPKQKSKRGPALAYQFGNTIIVEDEDGEVVKKYDLPSHRDTKKAEAGAAKPKTPRKDKAGEEAGAQEGESSEAQQTGQSKLIQGLNKWSGFNAIKETQIFDSFKENKDDYKDDEHIRFTIGSAGRRLTKEDFLNEIRSLDPKGRAAVLERSDAPPAMKDLARRDADASIPGSNRLFSAKNVQSGASAAAAKVVGAAMAGAHAPKPEELDGAASSSSSRSSEDAEEHRAVARKHRALFAHAQDSEDRGAGSPGRTGVIASTGSPSGEVPESAAERRRREQALKGVDDDDVPATKRVATPADRRRESATTARRNLVSGATRDDSETPAEWRRRIAALGHSEEQEGDEDEASPTVPTLQSQSSTVSGKSRGIRFAEDPVRGRK